MNSVLRRSAVLLSCHKLPSPSTVILRKASFLEKLRNKPIILDKTNYRLIYDFRYIVFPAGIFKMKKTIAIVGVPIIGASFYLNQPEVAGLITVGCFLQILIIIGVSRALRNLVGKIYVNKKGKINDVIISSIDSNGTRIDERFSPDQIDLSDLALPKALGFVQFETEGSDKKYTMNIKNIRIHDLEALKTIFSDISLYLSVRKNKS